MIRLSAGEHKLKLEKDGLEAEIEEFTVTKDGKTRLQVKMIEGLIAVLKNGESPKALAKGDTPVPSNPDQEEWLDVFAAIPNPKLEPPDSWEAVEGGYRSKKQQTIPSLFCLSIFPTSIKSAGK